MSRPLHTARPLLAVAAALLLVGAPARAEAQSLFAQRGLGLVAEPQSARSTGLGGVSLGLPGLEISWDNPAAAAGLPAPGLLVGVQHDDFEAHFSGREANGATTRFPLIMAAFPFGDKWAVTAGFGSLLDQRWAIQQADTLRLDGDTVPVIDRVSSDGGVSRLRLGAGYRVVPQLSLGLGLDLYTGGTERMNGRIFPLESTPGCCAARWGYTGAGALASLDWYPNPAFRLGLSGSVGGTLKAKPKEDVTISGDTIPPVGVPRSYNLPASLAVGASGRVAANTLVAASAAWSGWSSMNGALADVGGARDNWSAHGGVEWDALSVLGRTVPLRLGGRYETLPFRDDRATAESSWSTERALSLGTGVILSGGATRTDLSLERGSRGAEGQGLAESFWRLNFSVTVLGQ